MNPTDLSARHATALSDTRLERISGGTDLATHLATLAASAQSAPLQTYDRHSLLARLGERSTELYAIADRYHDTAASVIRSIR